MRSALVVALTGCILATIPTPAAIAAERESALRLLNSLPVAPEHRAGYAREKFADWLDLNRNGCNAREDVLIAERLSGKVVGCRVVNGRWLSSYDGVTVRNPSRLDVDHRVPLEEAWASGAWR